MFKGFINNKPDNCAKETPESSRDTEAIDSKLSKWEKQYRLPCEACTAGLNPGRRMKLIKEGLYHIKKGDVESGVNKIGQAYLENRETTGLVGSLFVCREPSCEKECVLSGKVPLRLSHLWLYRYMHYLDMKNYREIEDNVMEDISDEEKRFIDKWRIKQDKLEQEAWERACSNLRKE